MARAIVHGEPHAEGGAVTSEEGMPGTLANASNIEWFERFQAGDLVAFDEFVRQHFSRVAWDATAHVGDAERGARVATRVVAAAWEQRDRFASIYDLDRWLDATVHVESVREERRSSAELRWTPTSPPPAVPEPAAATAAEPAPTPPSSREAEVAPEPSPVPPSHRHTRPVLRSARYIAGEPRATPTSSAVSSAVSYFNRLPLPRALQFAVGTGVLLIAVVLWRTNSSSSASPSSALADTTGSRLVSATARSVVPLSDGTAVDLAPGATIRIPRAFGGAMRAVILDGGAALQVPAIKGTTFAAKAGSAMITTTAARFAVDGRDQETLLRVDDGSVTVAVDTVTKEVKAGEALRISGKTTTVASAADIDAVLAWTTGRLALKAMPLKALLPIIKQWYALDVKASGPMLEKSIAFTASLGAVSAALEALAKSGVPVKLDNGQFVAGDGPAAPVKSARGVASAPSSQRQHVPPPRATARAPKSSLPDINIELPTLRKLPGAP
jgi:ferric-dicitrate binding protein FerR (iron transport regulator)